jgi:hypothetical protein
MSFLKLLQGIGDRLGILETSPSTGAPAAVRIQTRSVSLRELTGETRPGAVEVLAGSTPELAVPFEKIFEAAGVSANPQDWTIERLKRVIEDESHRNKPREDVQKAVLALLMSEGVAAEVIVKDAMARDHAMDAYEAVARARIEARKENCKRRLSAAESRILELQEECRALEKTMRDDQARWDEWRKHKRERERELASIVGYIVDHKVITSEDQET